MNHSIFPLSMNLGTAMRGGGGRVADVKWSPLKCSQGHFIASGRVGGVYFCHLTSVSHDGLQ